MRAPVRLGRRSRVPPPQTRAETACHAPFTGLFFNQLGEVHACCFSRGYPLGRIHEQRLPEIWAGARRQTLCAAMDAGDLGLGCDVCDWRQSVGMETHASEYDRFTIEPVVPAWPKLMTFALTNACNLECVMCEGEISSAIRARRDRRPPLPNHYGEEFFDDLRAFVPHLEEANFIGGEPFLIRGNDRIWDLLAELAPDTPIALTTNATIWNARVERVVTSLPAFVNVSLDGFSKATFEAIRIGADRDVVFGNFERFAAVAARGVQILHCLMPQNVHEFADLVRFAEHHGVRILVNVITRGPSAHCLERLPRAELRAIRDRMASDAERLAPSLELNAGVLVEQVERLDRWLDHDGPPLALRTPGSREILDLATTGPSHDDGPARERVRLFAAQGTGPWVFVVDQDGMILSTTPGLEAALGLPPGDLTGREADAVRYALIRRFGAIVDERILERSASEVARLMTFPDTELLAVNVAVRGADGIARSARVHFATRPVTALRSAADGRDVATHEQSAVVDPPLPSAGQQ